MKRSLSDEFELANICGSRYRSSFFVSSACHSVSSAALHILSSKRALICSGSPGKWLASSAHKGFFRRRTADFDDQASGRRLVGVMGSRLRRSTQLPLTCVDAKRHSFSIFGLANDGQRGGGGGIGEQIRYRMLACPCRDRSRYGLFAVTSPISAREDDAFLRAESRRGYPCHPVEQQR